MVEIPFFKKITLPSFALNLFKSRPERTVGIDIGTHSTKVIQLKYVKDRAILETYGELLNSGYIKKGGGDGRGFLRYQDNDIIELLRDLQREANIQTPDAVFSVPATSGFVTTASLPQMSKDEIEKAIPFEARRYIPVPISEVVLEWEIINDGGDSKNILVLLIAIPKELIDKFRRISEGAGLKLHALEIETFSAARAIVGNDATPGAIINIGHQTTSLVITDQAKGRLSQSFNRGSSELTLALERGLGISRERAEELKKDIGLSERIEEQEISSIIAPLLETQITEIERTISIYNRHAQRKVQKIILIGDGSSLKGLVNLVSNRLGIEVTRGNPFTRIVTPPLLQPVLRNIGPNFAVAVGLALREITPQ